MNWVLIVRLIIELIGPYIVEWLRSKLLNEAEIYSVSRYLEVIEDENHLRKGLHEILDNVSSNYYFWQINKKLSILTLRKLIDRKIKDIFELSKTGAYDVKSLPQLTLEETLLLKDSGIIVE